MPQTGDRHPSMHVAVAYVLSLGDIGREQWSKPTWALRVTEGAFYVWALGALVGAPTSVG